MHYEQITPQFSIFSVYFLQIQVMRSIEELLPDIIAASVGAVALTLYHIWLVYMVKQRSNRK